jgi:hypothetical protein
LGGLNLDPHPSGESFCALIAFTRLKSYFFSMKKFFAAASLVISKTNSGIVGAGLASCLISWMMSMNELSWEGPFTVVLAVAGMLIGLLVEIIVIFLVV